MAARRLLIVMLVLFMISILATALAPTQDDGDSDTASTATTGTGTAAQQEASTPADPDPPLPVRIDADDKRLEVVKVEAGRPIELDVTSKKADSVEIPALGLIASVDPVTPAHFDLLLEEPGQFNVRLVDADRLAGRIDVSPANPVSPVAQQESAKAK